MGFMKSLFGNKGVQQEIPEYRIVITDVGPNPVQIISIIQKYLQSDYTELSNLINGNILDEQSTVCTLESLELLQQMQQELDEAGAFTYIQKNWQDEDDAEMNTSIAIFSLGDQGEKVIETSVYKGYKRDKIEMRVDRVEVSDFPLYLNTVASGLDRRNQAISGFSFVVKIYAVPVVEIIG